jgi:RNA polymerase sigma-70 factor (ECF subfamily)
MLGLSYEDAAELAGCPVGTVRSRVARARSTLVRLLAAAEACREEEGREEGREGARVLVAA